MKRISAFCSSRRVGEGPRRSSEAEDRKVLPTLCARARVRWRVCAGSSRALGLLEASDPAQVRWVSPRSVDMHELAWWKFDAASLCAGLQRHLGRRSTSTSRSEPREPRRWHRGREAVRHAWFESQTDLPTLGDRPDQHAARSTGTHQLGAARSTWRSSSSSTSCTS